MIGTVAALRPICVLTIAVASRRVCAGGSDWVIERTDADPERTQLIDPTVLERYRDFRTTVEREFRRWHVVGPYAQHLGYSPKSLDRSCRAAAALSAKRVIVERIILEAKRILAHSQLPIASISHQLGFDEPTNFVKYFKRETGATPDRLRAHLRSDKRT